MYVFCITISAFTRRYQKQRALGLNAKEREGGRKEGRVFSGSSLHAWKTGHLKLKNPSRSFLIEDLVCTAPIFMGMQTSPSERAILPFELVGISYVS